MNTKQRLQTEKEQLRQEYKDFPDKRVAILKRVDEIDILLRNMCYFCQNEPRKYNEYYCSEECNEKYYAPRKKREEYKPTVFEMQQRLRELGKQARQRLNQNGKV